MATFTKGSFALLNQQLANQVGIMEHPIGSNCQIYSHDLGRPCEYWCQDFAADMGRKAGINMFGADKTAYTPNAAKAYQAAGRYGKVARLGAQAFFYHSDLGRIGHTAWVIWVSADGKTIITVEGNSNNDGSRNGIGVFRLHRKVDASVTFGYPAYKTTTPPAPPSAPTPKPTPPPTLRQGNTGNWVLDLQHRLVKLGAKLALDGSFGPGTFKAVVAFQKAHDLVADGVVGLGTWSVLFKLT